MVRVAFVHDYFAQHGGAENVAGELYKLVPHADMFATVALDRVHTGLHPERKAANIVDSKPAAYRGALSAVLPTLSARSTVIGSFRYDLVISSSSGYGKGVEPAVTPSTFATVTRLCAGSGDITIM